MKKENQSPTLAIIGDIAYDTKEVGSGSRTDLGGGAYGAIVGASVFKKDVGLVAKVGEDFDIKHVSKLDIDFRGLSIVSGSKTAHFTLFTDERGGRYVRSVTDLINDADTEIFPLPYLRCEYFHLSTSHPKKYLEWIQFLRKKAPDCMISVDAFELYAQQFPLQTLEALSKANLIFINEQEMEILGKEKILSLNKPIVLKRGALGAEYISAKETISLNAPHVHALDTTGAGDVLAGAFLALLIEKRNVKLSLALSIMLASLSTTEYGVSHLIDKPLF